MSINKRTIYVPLSELSSEVSVVAKKLNHTGYKISEDEFVLIPEETDVILIKGLEPSHPHKVDTTLEEKQADIFSLMDLDPEPMSLYKALDISFTGPKNG